MTQRFSPRATLLGLAVLAVAGAATAQDLPTSFVPRCQVDELRSVPDGQDPCGEAFAVFGLHGPTVLAHGPRDVEATGSLFRQDRTSDAKR